MIAALELQDLVALAEGAGGPHGVEIGLGAGADEAHLLGAGHGVADRLGERDAVAVVAEEGRAERHLRLHRRRHLGMGVADEHRAGAQQEVDILAACLVPDAAALALLQDHLGRHVAEAAARQDALGLFDEIAGGIEDGLGHGYSFPHPEEARRAVSKGRIHA